jgi:hypothetical protein
MLRGVCFRPFHRQKVRVAHVQQAPEILMETGAPKGKLLVTASHA